MAGELAFDYDAPIPIADAIIASTAERVGGLIATEDKHFRKLGARTTWYKRKA